MSCSCVCQLMTSKGASVSRSQEQALGSLLELGGDRFGHGGGGSSALLWLYSWCWLKLRTFWQIRIFATGWEWPWFATPNFANCQSNTICHHIPTSTTHHHSKSSYSLRRLDKSVISKESRVFQDSQTFLIASCPLLPNRLLGDNNYLTCSQTGEIIDCVTSY